MKIIGYQNKDFTFEDGKTVNGYYLYLTEERKNVVGEAVERVFVSSSKLDGYVPSVGDEIYIYYNRYGKVVHIDCV